jgi:hypothetical protein
LHQSRKALAFQELHGDELETAGLSHIEDADYILVRNLAGEQQLLRESLHDFGMAGEFGPDALERDYPLNVAVVSFVNCSHAAHAENFHDLKAPGNPFPSFKY